MCAREIIRATFLEGSSCCLASRLTLVEEDVAPRASLDYSSSELEVKTSPSIENSLLSLLQEQSFVSEVVVVVVIVVIRVIGRSTVSNVFLPLRV